MDKAGLRVTSRQLNHLWIYYNLIESRNPEFDLTRVSGLTGIAVKHFIDCAMVAKLIDLPGSLLDIGTGAGFPGIVLKIMRPFLSLVLAEPRPRRIAFLHEVVRELALDGVVIHERKITVEETDIAVDGAITRALENIPTTLRRVHRIIPVGGSVIFMKGPAVDEELARLNTDHIYDFRCATDIPYVLPTTNHRRRLLVFERVDDPDHDKR